MPGEEVRERQHCAPYAATRAGYAVLQRRLVGACARRVACCCASSPLCLPKGRRRAERRGIRTRSATAGVAPERLMSVVSSVHVYTPRHAAHVDVAPAERQSRRREEAAEREREEEVGERNVKTAGSGSMLARAGMRRRGERQRDERRYGAPMSRTPAAASLRQRLQR